MNLRPIAIPKADVISSEGCPYYLAHWSLLEYNLSLDILALSLFSFTEDDNFCYPFVSITANEQLVIYIYETIFFYILF